MKRLIRLYPRAWRERYGEEFAALVEEQPFTLRTLCDLLGGAVDAHLAPQVQPQLQGAGGAGMVSSQSRWLHLLGSFLILPTLLYILMWVLTIVGVADLNPFTALLSGGDRPPGRGLAADQLGPSYPGWPCPHPAALPALPPPAAAEALDPRLCGSRRASRVSLRTQGELSSAMTDRTA